MTRLIVLVLALALLTGTAFGSEAFLRSLSGLFGGGGGVDVNIPIASYPRRGYGFVTPGGQVSFGYGFGR